MNDINLNIFLFDSRPASEPWVLNPSTHIQRFYYIKSGTGWYLDARNNKNFFKPGHIYIMPYDMQCHFYQDPDDRIDHIFIDFLSSPLIMGGAPLEYPVGEDTALMTILETIDRLKNESTYSWRGVNYRSCVVTESMGENKQILEKLLSVVLTLVGRLSPIPFVTDGGINRAVEYIHEHYSEPITNEQLAKRAGFVTHYFIERFKSVMYETPYAYLRFYRLTKAVELLGSGNSLTRTAELVGYENSSSLSRALRQEGFEGVLKHAK